MTTDLTAVRDEILRRADIVAHAQAAGFRRRGRSWFCVFHKDHVPSVSIKNRHVHCFACNRTWDAIDLVRKMHGLDYVSALKVLAAELFIPWPDENFTPEQRAVYAGRRREAERSARSISRLAFWWLQSRLAELSDAKVEAIKDGHINIEILAGSAHELYRLERLTADDVLREYDRFRREHPERFLGLISFGHLWQAACVGACRTAVAKLQREAAQ